MVFTKIADLDNETLVVIARFDTQFLRFDGQDYYPDENKVVRLNGTGEVMASPHSWWDLLTIVDGNYSGPPFTGDMPGYRWTGDENNSTSESFRHAKLYRITDEITTDKEDFTCLVRTKIFHFDSPSKYKRLFWWGIDAIYRKVATGRVIPVTYGSAVTWGELLNYTWNQLLSGTWRQPFVKGSSLETIRPELGLSAQRKFSKFRKGIRFRQAQFEVEFETDGSMDSAPVRLFSIHTEVNQAQTVSKAIT